jgi:predicted outer membrane protein
MLEVVVLLLQVGGMGMAVVEGRVVVGWPLAQASSLWMVPDHPVAATHMVVAGVVEVVEAKLAQRVE